MFVRNHTATIVQFWLTKALFKDMFINVRILRLFISAEDIYKY